MRRIDGNLGAELLGSMALAAALGGPARAAWPIFGACAALGPRLLDRLLLAARSARVAPGDLWIVPDPRQPDWQAVLQGLTAAMELTVATGQSRIVRLAPCCDGPGRTEAYRLTVAPASHELRLDTATAHAARPLTHLPRMQCPLPLTVSTQPVALHLASATGSRLTIGLPPDFELAASLPVTAIAALAALPWDWRLALLLAGIGTLRRGLTRPIGTDGHLFRRWRPCPVQVHATHDLRTRRAALLVAWVAAWVLLRHATVGTSVEPLLADPLRLALLGIALPLVLARRLLNWRQYQPTRTWGTQRVTDRLGLSIKK